ncbi:MAG: hypothetical protein CMH81_05955 [Nitrospiraceae bacterium]|nr:hypothetical protein [Nitrospiraceae bacterium]
MIALMDSLETELRMTCSVVMSPHSTISPAPENITNANLPTVGVHWINHALGNALRQDIRWQENLSLCSCVYAKQ